MKMKNILIGIAAVAAIAMAASCSRQDDFKDEFNTDNEIVYAGALDSMIAQSGYKRINLKMVLGKDPQVTRIKVYWDDRRDSVEIAVTHPLSSDTINRLINNLSVGSHSFVAYTFDKDNHTSVVRNASGVVYDDDYANSLANRTLRSITPNANVDSQFFRWEEPNSGQISTEIKYTLKNGTVKTFILAPTDTGFGISEDFLIGSSLQYRSSYIPNANSYDTFVVKEYSTAPIPTLLYERQLLKSGFKQNSLPTDVGASTFATWIMPALWNGSYITPGYATAAAALPVSFTFDTGESTRINRLIYWMPSDRIFNLESVKSFEIWGTNAPASDGTWASWTYLTTCTSIKPSGSAAGTNTAADVAAAAAGQEFIIPDGTPKTRYLRIKILSRWGVGTFQAMGELTLFTRDRK